MTKGVPVAISVDLLKRRTVFHFEAAAQTFVVTTSAGANRVYRAGDHQFDKVLPDGAVLDRRGARWRVTEEALGSQERPE